MSLKITCINVLCSGMQAVKGQMRLRICASSPVPLLLTKMMCQNLMCSLICTADLKSCPGGPNTWVKVFRIIPEFRI